MAAVDSIKPGDTLGRYELLLRVAHGGMAAVWASRLRGARGFTKLVALKTMLPGVSDDPDFERMFLDEARIASRIRHPNVVETLELGEDAGLLYIVMEWVDGETLDAIMKAASRSGGVPLPIALKIVCDACLGVHAAHELRDEENRPLGLVHRDVSPPNILVTYDGGIKLADFGVAKASQLDVPRTHAGVIKGKFRYMAPEQFTTMQVDRRTDVFSLGIILYQLTTGQHPWSADTGAGSLHKMFSMPPPSPQSLVEGYPAELERIVIKTLALEPAERFQTAAELGDAVRALAASLEKQATDRDLSVYVAERVGSRGAARRAALHQAAHEADERTGYEDSPGRSGRPVRTGRPVAVSIPEMLSARTGRSKRVMALGLAIALLTVGYALGGHGGAESADAAVPARSGSVIPQPNAGYEGHESVGKMGVPEGSASPREMPTSSPSAPVTGPRATAAPQPRQRPSVAPSRLRGAATGRTPRSDEPEPDVGF